MKKNCICCGKEFEAQRRHAKYCSKKCMDHNRAYLIHSDERKAIDEERKNKFLTLYNAGYNDSKISEQMGLSNSKIRKIRLSLGLKKQLTSLQSDVLKYRQKGLCCTEIAELLDKPNSAIRQTANSVGMPFTDEEKAKSIEMGKAKAIVYQHGAVEERIEKNKIFIEKYHPGFEYVSGWLSGNEIMKLQCKGCGTIVEKSAIGVRRKNRMLKCPVCAEKEKERKQEEIKIQKEKEKKEKETLFWLQPFKQEAVSFCPICNSVFVGNGRKKYCSTSCSKKMLNARGKDKRIRKIKNYTVDPDIEIHALFNRDNGKCWICGEQCDFEDYEIIDGAFVVGKTYPSIDHVFPLSKGGLHSWDNVKLAHHYCNTIKSDKVVGL